MDQPSASQLSLSFSDTYGNACYAAIDQNGVARVAALPQEIDAVIDEHVRIAMDLGQDVLLCHDRQEIRQLEEAQAWRMEAAADIQAEWSYVVLLPAALTRRLWEHEETVCAALGLASDETVHATFECLQKELRSVLEASVFHPAKNQAP